MKNVFLMMFCFVFSGCAVFYGMTEVEYQEKRSQYEEIKKYTNCLTFSGYDDLLKSGYNHVGYKQNGYYVENYSEYVHYKYEDVVEVAQKIKMCPTNLIWPWARNSYFKQQLQKHVAARDEQESQIESEKEQKALEELQKQSLEKHLKELETKYKVNMCRNKKSLAYYLFHNESFPSDCAFEILTGSLEMVQQLPDGTLVRPSNTFNNVLLILRNSKDSAITGGIYDRGYIPYGLFKGAGMYEYTNLRGIQIKAIKLKRVY